MPNYKKMYYRLVAKTAETIDALIIALEDGENAYCDVEEKSVIVLEKLKQEKQE